MTKETVDSTDTMYEYDEYGRLTRKYQGDPENPTCVSGYAWRYGDKLAQYLSNFPGESGAATYEYGGDGKRRERTVGGNTTSYWWDAGWDVINKKTPSGQKWTFVRGPAGRQLGAWYGTNPSSTYWRHYHHDIIGSTRMGTNDGKATIKEYDYTPYGEMYSESGWGSTGFKFTGALGPTYGLYYFPFRHYSPSLGRWLTRDPIPSVNMYSYVGNNPIAFTDPLGLLTGQQCNKIQEMLGYEGKWYTTRWDVGQKYNNTWGWNKMGITKFSNQPIMTDWGYVDLDWFVQLNMLGVGRQGIRHITGAFPRVSPTRFVYNWAKKFWKAGNKIAAKLRNADVDNILPPYGDWKERNTVYLLENGIDTLRELFPPEFMARECGECGGG